MPIFQFRFILPPKKQIIFHETRKFTSSSSPSTRIIIEVSTGCDWHLDCAIEATYLYDAPMIRIETSERRDLVTLALSGRIQAEDLPELKRVMESYSKPVVLDLTGVKLIDRDAVRFLAKLETDNATITNCPRYIREWILRERAQP
jgi:ABC-type transporter Mla MlaB component